MAFFISLLTLSILWSFCNDVRFFPWWSLLDRWISSFSFLLTFVRFIDYLARHQERWSYHWWRSPWWNHHQKHCFPSDHSRSWLVLSVNFAISILHFKDSISAKVPPLPAHYPTSSLPPPPQDGHTPVIQLENSPWHGSTSLSLSLSGKGHFLPSSSSPPLSSPPPAGIQSFPVIHSWQGSRCDQNERQQSLSLTVLLRRWTIRGRSRHGVRFGWRR